ncbi:MAG: hypothetical protein ACT4NX_08715 [Deltaproteobacteria bacterium]
MTKLPILALIICLALAAALSCADTSERDIEAVLASRENAFETRDVEKYLSLIAPNYREDAEGKHLGLEDIKKRFLANISIFDEIALSSLDRDVYRRGEQIEVFQKVKVRVKVDKDEGEFLAQEVIAFAKVNGVWMIVKESKADFLGGFVFGDLK